MVRAVVADEHAAQREIDRVEFGEAAADVEAVYDHHGDAGLDIELAAHREPGAGEERVADDEIGYEGAEFPGFESVLMGQHA